MNKDPPLPPPPTIIAGGSFRRNSVRIPHFPLLFPFFASFSLLPNEILYRPPAGNPGNRLRRFASKEKFSKTDEFLRGGLRFVGNEHPFHSISRRDSTSNPRTKRGETMKLLRFFLVAGMLVSGLYAVARAEEPRWHDEAELTFVDTSGNTEVTTLSAKNTLTVPFSGTTKGTWKLGALYGKSEGVKNAESYFTEIRLDHSYTERLYSFGYGGWQKDKFAGIDAWYYLGAGGGYKFFTGPKHFLLGEAGLAYTRKEYTDNTANDFPGGRFFGKYEYRFTEKNKFTQSLEWLSDFSEFDNWNLNSETALLSALNSWLSLKASYLVKYDNNPIAGVKKTDRILGMALVMNF
jgi:putative salt-induced outer membrane protein